MAFAALIGTTVGYTDYYTGVFLEANDGRAIVISKSIFEAMYHRLDEFTAAMKTDCIEYVSNSIWRDPTEDLFEQPQWYISAVEDGVIYGSCGMDMFYPETGEEIPMSDDSVILRNRQGKLRYMEWNDFIKYYDVTGE